MCSTLGGVWPGSAFSLAKMKACVMAAKRPKEIEADVQFLSDHERTLFALNALSKSTVTDDVRAAELSNLAKSTLVKRGVDPTSDFFEVRKGVIIQALQKIADDIEDDEEFVALRGQIDALHLQSSPKQVHKNPLSFQPHIDCALVGCVLPDVVGAVLPKLLALLHARLAMTGAEYDPVAADVANFLQTFCIPRPLPSDVERTFAPPPVGDAAPTIDVVQILVDAMQSIRADFMTNDGKPGARWLDTLVSVISTHGNELIFAAGRMFFQTDACSAEGNQLIADLWATEHLWGNWLSVRQLLGDTSEDETRPMLAIRQAVPETAAALLAPSARWSNAEGFSIDVPVQTALLHSATALRASCSPETQCPAVTNLASESTYDAAIGIAMPSFTVQFAGAAHCAQHVEMCTGQPSHAETVHTGNDGAWEWKMRVWCGARHRGKRPVWSHEALHPTAARALFKEIRKTVYTARTARVSALKKLQTVVIADRETKQSIVGARDPLDDDGAKVQLRTAINECNNINALAATLVKMPTHLKTPKQAP
jgi:hypothetical protein